MFIYLTDGRALEFHGAHITATAAGAAPCYHVGVIEYNGRRTANNEIIYSTPNEDNAKQLIADLCTAAGEGLPVFPFAEWETKNKEV